MSNRDDADLPLSRQKPVADDVRGELEFHIAQRTQELIAKGHVPDEARRLAQEAFGDLHRFEAECREIETRRRVARRRARGMEELRQDLKIGGRLLARSPGYTLAAIVTLALGIGANTAVFSIVNDVLLTPLATENADRLVSIVERHEQGWGNLPWSTFVEMQEQSRSFTSVTQHATQSTTVLGADQPLKATVAWVSSGFFQVFPVRVERGRLPLPEEHRRGASPVAIVSHAFWRDRLGSPASLAGIRLRVSFDHEVIGVLPPGYEFPGEADVWVPGELIEQSTSHTSHGWTTIARLRPGIDAAAAQQELDGILRAMKERYYPDFDAVGSTVAPLQDVLTQASRTPLYLLLGASGILLLAACTNLVSAGLARATIRSGEFAVRTALGASRARLVRQLLTESALLAGAGALAGLLVARLLVRAVLPLAPRGLELGEASIDARVLGFAALVAVVITILIGLLPALRAADSRTGTMLRSLRGTGDPRRRTAWHVLVSAEVALAIVLLSGSGLLLRSFALVMRTELGFEPANVLRTDVELPAVNYDGGPVAIPAFHTRALERIRAIPGIETVGFVTRLPLTGTGVNGAMEVEGKPHHPRGPFTGSSIYRVVGGDYFGAMSIPILEGRAFGAGDDRAGPPVVIVSATFARTEWPGETAIGKRVRPVGMDGPDSEPWHTVIGVVGDTRTASVTDRYREVYYFDYRQRASWRSYSTVYVTRTSSGASLAPAIQRAIATVDPQVPIEQRQLSSLVSESVADRRFTMVVLGAFAVVAVMLAIVGIYAVVSYTVAQRTRELGVRLALGASPARLRTMVLVSAMRSIVPGLAAGAVLAISATSAMRSLLYGVTPLDPVALGAAVVILAIAGLVSTLRPAIRATRLDPLIAMRAE
jgi:putative ABC transport system permease protein